MVKGAFEPNTGVLKKFIRWIEGFDSRYARMWAYRYRDDPEAATCEAMFWGVLSDCGLRVEPNEDLDNGQAAPDFVCFKDTEKFYVEVTCIQKSTATSYSGISDTIDQDEATHYSSLNSAIHSEVVSKTKQCANLDAPCVLAIGTFHYTASVLCVRKKFTESLLTGEPLIGWKVDTRTGKAVGDSYQCTKLESASFLRPGKLVGIEPARQTISAIVIAGFGCEPITINGAIHPYAVRPFNPNMLDRIPFCRLVNNIESKKFNVTWATNPNC